MKGANEKQQKHIHIFKHRNPQTTTQKIFYYSTSLAQSVDTNTFNPTNTHLHTICCFETQTNNTHILLLFPVVYENTFLSLSSYNESDCLEIKIHKIALLVIIDKKKPQRKNDDSSDGSTVS